MYYTSNEYDYLTMQEKYGMGQVLSDSMGQRIDQVSEHMAKLPRGKEKSTSVVIFR